MFDGHHNSATRWAPLVGVAATLGTLVGGCRLGYESLGAQGGTAIVDGTGGANGNGGAGGATGSGGSAGANRGGNSGSGANGAGGDANGGDANGGDANGGGGAGGQAGATGGGGAMGGGGTANGGGGAMGGGGTANGGGGAGGQAGSGPAPLGATCKNDPSCASGICAEGICCEARCADACTGCDSTGKCAARPAQAVYTASATRQNQQPLRSATIPASGAFYVEALVCPTTGPVKGVEFWWDDAEFMKSEASAPFDLNGTDSGNGLPHYLDSAVLPKGPHSLAIRVQLIAGGTAQAVTTPFEIQAAPTDILYGKNPDLTGLASLAGATVSGSIVAALAPGVLPPGDPAAVTYLDGKRILTEFELPLLAWGGVLPSATLFDTRTIANGTHILKFAYTVDALPFEYSVTFQTAN